MVQARLTRPPVAGRQRGGQPGNQNARKHGYYSDVLDEQQRAPLAGMPPPANHIEAALRLQRLKTASVIAHDPLNLPVIDATAKRLIKLEEARDLLELLSKDRRFRKKFKDAFARYGLPVVFPDANGVPSQAQDTAANVQILPREPMYQINLSQARPTHGRSSTRQSGNGKNMPQNAVFRRHKNIASVPGKK